jgi:formylmethanofuran dehydrogenase subunit E
MDRIEIGQLLDASAARHSHLCPRQVLGVRSALAGIARLGLSGLRRDKRLLVIVESDGCFLDGVEAASGASPGHRTLRVEDYGKIAATFINTVSTQAVRVAPALDVRQRAWKYAPGETRRYFAQLQAYQVMPDDELLTFQPVRLKQPIDKILSRPGIRVCCQVCGEEIINERELNWAGSPLCRACAGAAYYDPLEQVWQPAPELITQAATPGLL